MANNEVATTGVQALKKMLEAESVKKQFENIYKENAQLFLSGVLDLYSSTPQLQSCKPSDIIKEVLKAAVLKLPISKQLGFAYIVPYKGTPSMILGYKGLYQLALRSNMYKTIHCDVVYEGEEVLTNKLTGWIDFSGEKKSDKVVGYFAHFELHNGFSKTIYMTKENIISYAKRYSKSYSEKPDSNSIWLKEFDSMSLKTVLRRLLSKWGILTIELAAAISEDIEAEGSAEDELERIKANKANKKTMDFEDADIVSEGDENENPI